MKEKLFILIISVFLLAACQSGEEKADKSAAPAAIDKQVLAPKSEPTKYKTQVPPVPPHSMGEMQNNVPLLPDHPMQAHAEIPTVPPLHYHQAPKATPKEVKPTARPLEYEDTPQQNDSKVLPIPKDSQK